MKVLMVFFLVFFLSGSTWVTGSYNLFALEDNEAEKEMINEGGEQELEGIEGEEKVDMDDYLRILNEEGQEEVAPEEERNDLRDEEKEYPEDKLIDDRG